MQDRKFAEFWQVWVFGWFVVPPKLRCRFK